MLLVIKKVRGKQATLVFIPKLPLYDLLERHVERKDLVGETTCLVTKKNNYQGFPSNNTAVKLLIETLYAMKLGQGERRYPIPKHLWGEVLCRSFNRFGFPLSDAFEGDFVINLNKVERQHLRQELSRYGKLNMFDEIKVKNTFKKLQNYDVIIYVLHHVHPAKPIYSFVHI